MEKIDIKASRHNLQLNINILAMLIIILGLTVMIGWLLKLPILVQILPNSVPMQFNTALCFAFSGLAILFYKIKPTFAWLLAAMIIAVAGLTLIEYCFDLSMGLDQLIIEPFVSTKTSHPGRMAPNTALCFVLFSLFILFSQGHRVPDIVIIFLPSIVGVLGLIAIIGYVFNIEQAYAWGALTQMAVHTSMGFVLLAVASFLLFASTNQLSKKQISILVDYAVFSSSILFFLMLWQVVNANYISALKDEAANQIEIINAQLSVEVKRDVEAIIRLFSRYSTKSYSSVVAFNRDVDYYFEHMAALEVMLFNSRGQIVSNINPYIKQNLNVEASAFCDVLSRYPRKLNPEVSKQDSYICVQSSDASATINLAKIIEQIIVKNSKNFNVLLAGSDKLFYESNKTVTEDNKFWAEKEIVNLCGLNLTLTVSPNSQYIDQSMGRVPYLILLLGGFISFLLLFLLRYRRKMYAERQAYEEKLHALALYDQLTNLPNRYYIISHLKEVIARAQRHLIGFSVCYIDIDKFKYINDNYGHHVGDKALQYVALRIASVIRKNDFFGRMSGDEFCLILDGIYLKQDTDRVLEKIRQSLQEPFTADQLSMHISLSVGLVPYTNELSPEELLIKADNEMYRNKNT